MGAATVSAATDEGFCRNGGFLGENADVGLGRVGAGGRAFFLSDRNGCPSPAPQCRQRAYVLPGDQVLTGRIRGDYVCAYFPNRGGGSAGWVERSRLDPLVVDERPPTSSWVGDWSDSGNPELSITAGAGAPRVTGQAYWPGPQPEKGWPPGWPHSGEIDGKLSLQGHRGRYSEDDCRIDFVLVGPILIAKDNTQCGGINVTFSGLYSRVTR